MSDFDADSTAPWCPECGPTCPLHGTADGYLNISRVQADLMAALRARLEALPSRRFGPMSGDWVRLSDLRAALTDEGQP